MTRRVRMGWAIAVMWMKSQTAAVTGHCSRGGAARSPAAASSFSTPIVPLLFHHRCPLLPSPQYQQQRCKSSHRRFPRCATRTRTPHHPRRPPPLPQPPTPTAATSTAPSALRCFDLLPAASAMAAATTGRHARDRPSSNCSPPLAPATAGSPPATAAITTCGRAAAAARAAGAGRCPPPPSPRLNRRPGARAL